MYHHSLVCTSEIPKHTWGHYNGHDSSLLSYLQGLERTCLFVQPLLCLSGACSTGSGGGINCPILLPAGAGNWDGEATLLRALSGEIPAHEPLITLLDQRDLSIIR